MAKKLAELIAHMATVQRSGDLDTLNEDMTADASKLAYLCDTYWDSDSKTECKLKTSDVNSVRVLFHSFGS